MKAYERLFMVFAHVLLWSVIIVIPKFFLPADFKVSFKVEFLIWFPILFFFYVNYFFLVPSFLINRKFILYTISIIAILALTMVIGSLNPSMWEHTGKNQPPIPPEINRGFFIQMWGIQNVTTCFLFLAIGTSVRVTEQWYTDEKKRKEMENQKLLAELSFLKSQINPHFFFNTLNSIYSLAIRKSGKTPEALIKLSELMRFIIYDSEKEFVPLKRELEYINNYVELQKLRLMPNVHVDYQTEGNFQEKNIEPLLLLPFIENAFKHGIDAQKNCEIKIKVKASAEDLFLTVENPIVKQTLSLLQKPGGIGLANSRKRLQLLYGSNHVLNISQNNNLFKTELHIKFK